MAKKNIKRKENQEEPVTKCDQSKELVAKCDRLDDVVAKGKKKRCSFP